MRFCLGFGMPRCGGYRDIVEVGRLDAVAVNVIELVKTMMLDC